MEASAYNHFAVCRQRVHVCRALKTQLCELIFSPAAAKADDLTIAKLLMVRAEQCEQKLGACLAFFDVGINLRKVKQPSNLTHLDPSLHVDVN
jgi:hypothetical protein